MYANQHAMIQIVQHFKSDAKHGFPQASGIMYHKLNSHEKHRGMDWNIGT